MKLSDAAMQKLIHLITVEKKYQPGDKLPNEKAEEPCGPFPETL